MLVTVQAVGRLAADGSRGMAALTDEGAEEYVDR